MSGTKTWIDNNNSEGKRPTEVSISLKADGEVVRTETITGTDNNWKYTFEGLPKYKIENGQGGKRINYTAVENNVSSYYTATNAGDRSIINTINDLERDKSFTLFGNNTPFVVRFTFKL